MPETKESKEKAKDTSAPGKTPVAPEKAATMNPERMLGSTRFRQRYLGNSRLQPNVEGGEAAIRESTNASARGEGGTIVQAKFMVSQPGDKYEQEADQIADLVMQMPERRMAGRPEEQGDSRKPEPLSSQIARIAHAEHAAGRQPATALGLGMQHEALGGGGQPLPNPLRAFFEPRFGSALSDVRVHASPQAAESARALNAEAYTVGYNIVFGKAQYQPGTPYGHRLLAHELTHVIQQTGLPKREHSIQMRPARRTRYESLVLTDVPFDPSPKRYLFFEADVLLRIEKALSEVYLPKPWGPTLMWESNFGKDIFDSLMNTSPPPKRISIAVDFVKGSNLQQSRLWFALLSTSMHSGSLAERETTEPAVKELPTTKQKHAEKIAPLPWTAEELMLWKKEEIRRARKRGKAEEEKLREIEERFFIGAQVLKNWSTRYGKWAPGERLEGSNPDSYWVSFFENEMNPFGEPATLEKHQNDTAAHRKLWKTFQKQNIEHMRELSKRVQNPFSATPTGAEMRLRYEMEWQSRDPQSFEFNIAYREFMKFRVDKRTIENLKSMGLPQTVIGKVRMLEGDLIGEIPFFEAVREAISDEAQFQRFKFAIWREAVITGRVEPSPESQQKSKWLLRSEPFYYETKTNKELEWLLHHWDDEKEVAHIEAVKDALLSRMRGADWGKIAREMDMRCYFGQDIDRIEHNLVIGGVFCYGKDQENVKFSAIVDLRCSVDEQGHIHFVITHSSNQLLASDDLSEIIGIEEPLPIGVEIEVVSVIQKNVVD